MNRLFLILWGLVVNCFGAVRVWDWDCFGFGFGVWIRGVLGYGSENTKKFEAGKVSEIENPPAGFR